VSVDTAEQLQLLSQNASEIVPIEEFERKIEEGRPLRVKLGLDPTAEHVTLGWAVVLRRLRDFQRLGHVAVLIVGDFTAQIGDPSGRDETRPMLSKDEVDAYVERVLKQFDLIVEPSNLEIRRNSEWLEPLGTAGLLELATHHTVARMLERDDFAKRYAEGAAISVREFLYPLLQGYDSVAVKADVEIGGTDQHFNLMVGRHIQRAFGQEPQVVMTMPLLEGTDGVRKMSQSFGNYIGIAEPPDEVFGKLMRIPDELMGKYLRLTTDVSEDEIQRMESTLPPQKLKRTLAREVVKLYHGGAAAAEAADRFDKVFVSHEVPSDIAEHAVGEGEIFVPHLLVELGFADSSSDARRKITQGGVRIDDEKVTEEKADASTLRGKILRVGKRNFARLV
jgi:tyrosyl-tRNA synthetase